MPRVHREDHRVEVARELGEGAEHVDEDVGPIGELLAMQSDVGIRPRRGRSRREAKASITSTVVLPVHRQKMISCEPPRLLSTVSMRSRKGPMLALPCKQARRPTGRNRPPRWLTDDQPSSRLLDSKAPSSLGIGLAFPPTTPPNYTRASTLSTPSPIGSRAPFPSPEQAGEISPGAASFNPTSSRVAGPRAVVFRARRRATRDHEDW